jgi:hypothetical protein
MLYFFLSLHYLFQLNLYLSIINLCSLHVCIICYLFVAYVSLLLSYFCNFCVNFFDLCVFFWLFSGYICQAGSPSSFGTSLCPAGYYCPNNALSVVPVPCSPGFYSNQMGCSSASCCAACTAGYWCAAASTSATGNGQCAPGFYCAAGSAFYTGGGAGLVTQFYYSFQAVPSIAGPPATGWASPVGKSFNAVQLSWASYDSRTTGLLNFQSISTGFVYSNVTTTITFRVVFNDGVSLVFNGVQIFNSWNSQGSTVTTLTSSTLILNAGFNPITILFFDSGPAGGFATFDLYFAIGNRGFTLNGVGIFFGNSTRCPAGVYCQGGSTSVDGDGLCQSGSYCPAGTVTPTGAGNCTSGYFCPPGSISSQGYTKGTIMSSFISSYSDWTMVGLSSQYANGQPRYVAPPLILGTSAQSVKDINIAAAKAAPIANVYHPRGRITVDWSFGYSMVYLYNDLSASILALNGSSQLVSTFVGLLGSPAGTSNGVGSNARFYTPKGGCVDNSSGVAILYVVDSSNHDIRAVNLFTRAASRIAGVGSGSYADGVGTYAAFNTPYDATSYYNGSTFTLIVADQTNNRIRCIVPGTLAVSTLVGSVSGYADGIGTNARFWSPQSVAIGPQGTTYSNTLFVGDINNRIRSVNLLNLQVRTLAGSGVNTGNQGPEMNGVGTQATFFNPQSIASLEMFGKVYLYVTDFCASCGVRQIELPSVVVTTIVGTSGTKGSLDGSSLVASFMLTTGVAVYQTIRATGEVSLVVTDWGTESYRLVTFSLPPTCPSGTYTVAGCTSGYNCCLICNLGFVCGQSGAVPCPIGFACSVQGEPATPCPAGQYGNTTGFTSMSSCLNCPAGVYSSSTGLTRVCTTSCPSGFYCPTGSSVPVNCPVGAFCTLGSGNWSLCLPGSFCAGNSSLPSGTGNCAAGYYCPSGSTIATAQICPAGSYCTGTGGTTTPLPMSCLPGRYCNAGASTINGTGACLATTYCPGGAKNSSGLLCPAGMSACFFCQT